MKKIQIFLVLIQCVTLVSAQEQLSKKQLADKLFERYEYYKALNLYLPLTDKNNPDVRVVERVADCYRLMNDSKNAGNWYANAITYYNAQAIDWYYYAEALLQNNKLKEARTQYTAYYNSVGKPEELQFKLATCDSAAKWMAAPNKGYTINQDKKLNGIYAEWGVTYYGGNGVVFTSDRIAGSEDAKQTDNRTGNAYFKLFRANKDSVLLLPMSSEGGKIFNGDYHAGPATFNAAADTAWITITTTVPRGKLPVDKRDKGSHQRLYTRRLMLMMATEKDGVWGIFKNFAYNNIKAYSVGHAALSPDGSLLYFTSDMPGGEGGTDIWYCQKQSDGSWGKPANCGNTINTKGDEAFPVIRNDGDLEFSSDGLPGMGGYDLFEAKGKMAEWSTPVNHRYPVNSTADDFYFLTADGLSGYFSSNRAGGAGNDDIYSFKYQPQAQPVMPAPPTVIVSTPKPLFDPQDIHAIIYYDLDKSNIRPDAAAELDKLAEVLKANPLVKVKLASYTDVRASGNYNIGLSKRRSESAIAYLVKQGIAPARLSAGWFGEENLVADCPDHSSCTEAQHQLNRRTEVVYDGVLK
ncbi:OmpA family protein [Mucilaginibacter psychrotolerans]|nr:OmpA family protein [Mucilaginibacter psychrotolerans]